MITKISTNLFPKSLSFLSLKSVYGIYVQSFPTPNPNYLKFVPQNKQVLGSQGTLDISDSKFADVSPLAQQLFKIDGVKRVFYGPDYISVSKNDDIDWQALKPQIYKAISQNYQKDVPILVGQVAIDDGDVDPNDSETVQFIKQVLASRVRPTIQEDGGDVKFVSFDTETGKLVLKLVGACSSCPSSTTTMKNGIQKMLTYYIKDVKSVVSED